MKRVKLSSSASISTTATGVILNSDLGTFRLKGEDLSVFVEQMIPLLDGKLTREEIAKTIPTYSNASVLQLLSMLDERGLLENVDDANKSVIGPQERLAKVLPPNLLKRIKDAKILIVGLEPWGITTAFELAATGVKSIHLLDDRPIEAEDLLSTRSWSKAQIGKQRTAALKDNLTTQFNDIDVKTDVLKVSKSNELKLTRIDFDLIITGLNADDHQILQAVTKFAVKNNIPSLNGHLEGQEAWIGPALSPGESGCWDCYRLRKLANATNTSGSHEFDEALLAKRPAPRGRAMLAPMAPLVGHLMAMDALRLLGLNEGKRAAGSYRVMDLFSGKTKDHGFIPMPWCDTCGGAAKALEDIADSDSLEGPQSHILNMVHDGETLREIMGSWIDNRTGVIKDLTLTPDGQQMTLPRTASANVASFTQGEMKSSAHTLVGSGKSVNAVSAEIGALGEAIERYSASRFKKDAMHYASFDELDGDALDPGKLALYSPEQYESDRFSCTPWDPSQKIHWVEGHWMGSDDPVWVPALPTFFNFFVPHSERFCQVSSNGLAAGGDFKDAAVRATYELLERDAFMLNWLCRLPARRLIIDEDLSPELTMVMDQVGKQGAEIEFWVMDDLRTGIPTVVSLGIGDGKSWGGTSLGLSCHSDIRVAMQKALLEQAHFGPYLARIMQNSKIPKKPRDVRSLEEHALYYVPPAKRGAFDFLRSSKTEPILYSETRDSGPNDGDNAYTYLAERLKSAGLKVAAVDVTSPDVRLSPFRVARALGEYVQPIHFGYQNRPLANQRLDDLLAGRPVNPNPHPIA